MASKWPCFARHRSCGTHTPVGERYSMIGSRRAAITASLIGALLVAGAPTFAFGEGDASHQAKAQSAATSSDMTAQKAKDADDKQASDKKDSNKGDKQASDKKD